MRKLAILFLVSLSSAFALADTVIGFHTTPAGLTTPGQSITNDYAALGVNFSTDAGNAAITQFCGDDYAFAGTATCGWLTNSTDGFNDRQTHLNVNFSSEATHISFLYDNYGNSDQPGIVSIYGAGNVLIATLDLPNNGYGNDLVVIGFDHVTGLQLAHPQDGWIIAINDLTFDETPEPASLMLLGSGLIGTAGVFRRKFSF